MHLFILRGVFQRIHSLSEREKCVCASPATLETVEAEESGAGMKNHTSPISSFIKRMFVLQILFPIRVCLKDTGGKVVMSRLFAAHNFE